MYGLKYNNHYSEITKCIYVRYVLAHVGLDGNEKANEEAERVKSKSCGRMNRKKKVKEDKLIHQYGVKCLEDEEERVVRSLRNGHSGLNSSLYMIRKHNNGNYCGEEETVEHVLLYCQKYDSEREVLKDAP